MNVAAITLTLCAIGLGMVVLGTYLIATQRPGASLNRTITGGFLNLTGSILTAITLLVLAIIGAAHAFL